MAGVGGWKIEVSNLRQVFDALDEMDKKAGNRVKKMITDKAKDVATSAKNLTPSDRPVSNWGPWLPTRRTFKNDAGRDLSWERGAVIAGFKVKRSNYRRRGVSAGISWDVFQTNAAGAIFEVIGANNRHEDDSRPWLPGKYLVSAVADRFPRTKGPRTLVPAYYQNMTSGFKDEVRKAVIREAREAGLY